MDQIQVQVLFSEETQYGTFTDALYYSIDEWPIDDGILKTEKGARVQNYTDSVRNAPPPPPPTKEDLQKQIVEVAKQITEIALRAVEIGVTLDPAPINTDQIPKEVKP